MAKNTTNPSKRKRKKTTGFMARMKSAAGQKVLKRRRDKGRSKLSAS